MVEVVVGECGLGGFVVLDVEVVGEGDDLVEMAAEEVGLGLFITN